MTERFDIDDEEEYEAFSVEELAEILSEEEGLEVAINQKKKAYREIHVHCANPEETRKKLRFEIGPDIGVDFVQPRKTKKNGYMLQALQDGSDEVIIVKITKGGTHRAGRKNELDFQKFVKSEIADAGFCHLDISDNYGKRIQLDVVEVVDSSQIHGTDGRICRTDTTVKLKDGTIYGISHKKTNATYVCKIKKMFDQINAMCGRILRKYAKENGLMPGDYMDIRITERNLMDLCWFGTDIAQGAVLIGNFENMSNSVQHIERIIEAGDDDVITHFPIYTKWKIKNSAYTMIFCGVSVPSKEGKWVIDDVTLPGVNAPLPEGRSYNVGPKKKKRRRRKKRRTNESGGGWIFLEREEDMWDTIAWCAEHHKMVWLKYETVDDNEIISRRVAPYSYRTRRTKVRGKSTYFYGQDFTPGEDHTIKCFLVDNCLQAKKSPTSFSPKFTIEIKQEIDRLEDQRREEERKERERKKAMKVRKDDKAKTDAARKKTKQDIDKSKDIPKKPKPAPMKKKDVKPPASDKKVEVVKAVEKPPTKKPEVKKEPLPPPEQDEVQEPDTASVNDGEKSNVVSVDTDVGQDIEDNDIQITDDEGNVIEDDK